MNLMNLVACLEELGFPYKLHSNADGGAVVAMERGGRIIGLYPASDQPNMLWTNPILADRSAARDLFCRTNHWNVGGERIWLSPELEYHVVENGPAVSYTVQQTIDPGTYRFLEREGQGTSVWQQEGIARLFQSGSDVRFTLSKSMGLAEDPLRCENVESGTADYNYIGYESEIELASRGNELAPPLSSWSIIQVPAGGYAYAPTQGEEWPTDLFAPTGSGHLTVSAGMVRFKIDARESHKLSLKSGQTLGRFGYCRKDESGLCSLIVRKIETGPQSDYLDTPWNDPTDGGHCVQLYNDDGEIGRFGELEHHAAAVKWDEEQRCFIGRDRSHLWCYSGSREAIARIGYKLLGAEISFKS
jgi:hypothetical protein